MEQVANDGANAVETDDEVVDETSIIWKNTKDPKVHYHRIKNEWAISIKKTTVKTKKNPPKFMFGFHSEQDANDTMFAFRLSHETPVRGTLKGVPVLTNATRDLVLANRRHKRAMAAFDLTVASTGLS